MKFTSSRKLILAALGHVITFDKGDTLFVPPSLHQQALEQGLEPMPEDGEDVAEAVAKPDDASRVEAIKVAMKLIAERNNADATTALENAIRAGGIPKIRAIESLTDGAKPTDAKEHQALWAEVAASI